MPQKGTLKDGEKNAKSHSRSPSFGLWHIHLGSHVARFRSKLLPCSGYVGSQRCLTPPWSHWSSKAQPGYHHLQVGVGIESWSIPIFMPNCSCTELELHPAGLGRGVPAKSCSGFEHRGAQMVDFFIKTRRRLRGRKTCHSDHVQSLFKNNAQRISAFSRGYFSNLQKLAWEHQTVWSR